MARRGTHCLICARPYIATDDVSYEDTLNQFNPYHTLRHYMYSMSNYYNHRHENQRFAANQLPARLNLAKVVIYEQASMATQVTPPSDFSSITKALPSLSPNDLCTLQTNIASLLKTTNDDDDAEMESIPNLSDPDLDDFSLGCLDNKC